MPPPDTSWLSEASSNPMSEAKRLVPIVANKASPLVIKRSKYPLSDKKLERRNKK